MSDLYPLIAPYEKVLEEYFRLVCQLWLKRVDAELQTFAEALDQWLHELFQHPTPDWRESFDAFLSMQEDAGRTVTPESRQELLDLLEGWAASVDFRTSRDERSLGKVLVATVHIVSESEAAPQPVPKNWPALTSREAEAAQRSTGLPWWNPIQPRNQMDQWHERRFERLGQEARDKLLALYRELAVLGRKSRSIKDPETEDIEPLLAQQRKVQQSYDDYIRAKSDIYREWTAYLTVEWLIGPEVAKLFEKLEHALPNRIQELTSPLDNQLKQARRASHEATVKNRKRIETAHTVLSWTDTVITWIEIITLVGTFVGAFFQVTKMMIARGFSQAAAYSAAIAYTAFHLATAAASAVVIGGVIPEVLVGAGLDEADVRAGLAVFGAFSTIVGIRSAVAQRNQNRFRKKLAKLREEQARKAGTIVWDETHPLIEGLPDANRTRLHTLLQQALAEEVRADGSYVRVGMGRPLSEFSGLKHSPDIRPDVIGLTKDGKIDMFEIKSPSQSEKRLIRKLNTAMNQLPPEMRGEIRVTDPREAFE